MTKEDVGVLREQIEAGLAHLIADDYPRGVPAAAALDFQFRLITLLHLGDMAVQRSCILVLLEIGKSFYWVPSRAQYILAVSRRLSPKGAFSITLSRFFVRCGSSAASSFISAFHPYSLVSNSVNEHSSRSRQTERRIVVHARVAGNVAAQLRLPAPTRARACPRLPTLPALGWPFAPRCHEEVE